MRKSINRFSAFLLCLLLVVASTFALTSCVLIPLPNLRNVRQDGWFLRWDDYDSANMFSIQIRAPGGEWMYHTSPVSGTYYYLGGTHRVRYPGTSDGDHITLQDGYQLRIRSTRSQSNLFFAPATSSLDMTERRHNPFEVSRHSIWSSSITFRTPTN